MARLDTPTAIDVAGPWLVETRHLLALDDIYDSYLPRLEANQEMAIQEEIQQRMKDYPPANASDDYAKRSRERIEKRVRESQKYGGRERRITVYLPGGKTLQTERFSEVITHAGTTNEVALGFRSSLTVAPVTIVLGLGFRPYAEDELSLNVEPNTDPNSQEVYGALLNWVSDVQSPFWLQKWRRYRLRALGFFTAVLATMLFVGVGWNQQSATNYYKEEAHRLLGGGITAANQPRAVELLLAIASDYSGPATKGPGLRYWTTFFLLLLISICLYFCPMVVIGVWRGKARVKRWHIWIRTVSISIPALLLSTLGMPWILRWLGLLP
jgi:hypothetical protein